MYLYIFPTLYKLNWLHHVINPIESFLTTMYFLVVIDNLSKSYHHGLTGLKLSLVFYRVSLHNNV